ncbi:hypothetical protein G6F42_025802 [Rhizopus arrhizus]|nr:hypothetical protein G6F42_025802 [Rhizopus arrhizus]
MPEQWLKSVRRLISQFVLPFARAPSWETICRPKALGGLGLIDLKSQQLTLHMVYIQRILRPASEARQKMDFTTPFLLDLLSHHAGLNNVLPLFLFPSMYVTNTLSVHTEKMPLLHYLLKVIVLFVALLMFSGYPSSVDVAAIPLKWLVPDFVACVHT